MIEKAVEGPFLEKCFFLLVNFGYLRQVNRWHGYVMDFTGQLKFV